MTTVTGSTATRDPDNTSLSTSDKTGVIVTPNKPLGGLTVTLSDNTAAVDQLFVVRDSTGTVIGSKSVTATSGSTRTFTESDLNNTILKAGTDYRVLAQGSNSTDSYTAGEDDGPLFPFTSADIDMTAGVEPGSRIGTRAFCFSSVTAELALPDPPTNLSATASGDDISLSWDDNATTEDSYTVFRAQSSGSTVSDYTAIATLSAGTTSYTDSSLLDGEQYYYRVTASNAAGESDISNEATATTALPAPSDVLLALTTEGYQVEWTANSNRGDFHVETRGDGSTWSDVTTVGFNTRQIRDSLPSGGTDRRQYRVRAETADATSAFAIGDQPLTVTAVRATEVDLEWEEAAPAEDAVDIQHRRFFADGSVSDWETAVTLLPNTEAGTDDTLLPSADYEFRVRIPGQFAPTVPDGTTKTVSSPFVVEDRVINQGTLEIQ